MVSEHRFSAAQARIAGRDGCSPADGDCRSSGARRDGGDSATSGGAGIWKYSPRAGCDARHVGPSLARTIRPGCSLRAAATAQEPRLYDHHDDDAGRSDLRQQHRISWIDGTMLRPIPGARDTGDLVSLQRGERNFSPTPPFSYLDYRDLREQNHTFAGILAYHHDWITLTGGAQPERVYIANVSANYSDVLGIKPMLGRFFLAEEETRPAVPSVVLGYSLWKTRFAKDPAIVGNIEIARHPVTVIGVAPEGVVGAMPGLREDLWVTLDPLGTDEWRMTHRSGGAVWLNVIGRLRPGVSLGPAAQDLDTVMRHIVAAYPDQHLGDNRITLDPMWRSPFGANGYMAATLPILLAFAAVVLLLTSANVATLTLVRFVSRRRELAIRQSLGANRLQLVRQMVLEGVLLSMVAGAVALGVDIVDFEDIRMVLSGELESTHTQREHGP